MTYWRMQLCPPSRREAVKHTIESLVAGYIGLDFATEVGDLREKEQAALPVSQRHYWGFAHEMQKGDLVLIIAHQFPVALVTVANAYSYAKSVSPENGLRFHHFRRIEDVRYYDDFQTNSLIWDRITMVDAISRVRDPGSSSHRLIEEWRRLYALGVSGQPEIVASYLGHARSPVPRLVPE
jgi:hypothetical protein